MDSKYDKYDIVPTVTLGNVPFLQDEPRPTLRRGQPTRGKTLVRADRFVEQTPLISKVSKKRRKPSAWTWFSRIVTCCVPPICLKCCKIVGDGPQQAWREKVALCWIALFLSALVAFFIVGFSRILCPDPSVLVLNPIRDKLTGTIVIRGELYNATSTNPQYSTMFRELAFVSPGVDVSQQFNQPALPQCQNLNFSAATLQYPCEKDVPKTCLNLTLIETQYGLRKLVSINDTNGRSHPTNATPTFDWFTIRSRKLKAYKTFVLDFNPYFRQFPDKIANDDFDRIIRLPPTDLTKILKHFPDLEKRIMPCIVSKYAVGRLDEESGTCLFVNVIVYFTYIIVLGVTLVRFLLAVWFDWFIAGSLARDPKEELIKNDPYAQIKVGKGVLRESLLMESQPLMRYDDENRANTPSFIEEDVRAESDSDLYTVLLVTCYSEGEASLRTTLDSLANTEYNDRKKLLFLVADGIVTGKGNPKSTPDLLIDMLTVDPAFGGNPTAFSYVAVATGAKQHNMAKVYCGYFHHHGRSIPTILIVKCGTPEEEKGPKPGNRGKRDSQLVLMNFFNRVTLNDLMTPLDFDIFRKIHHISGVTPDFYEIVLMVDADTKVASDSLRLMINVMYNDSKVMGLCGETLIANKRSTWVTRIQVFEYYVSHHLGKAFESVWGGVTCLPGCFCCYRLKSRKPQSHEEKMIGLPYEWNPILVDKRIVDQYSTNKTETLHEKNLLLLGEDRFLSTLMLRTFPKRKMVFVPKAQCFTVVPDDFKTLLSQRRRWINSTIHNLMELVLVKNLCGTFCFSMQFVVFLDVLGTAVLPVSLVLLFVLLAQSIYKFVVLYGIEKSTIVDVNQLVPVILLLAVLFMPAFLVAFTSSNIISNLKWMFIYLLALPIWQLVLPLYAFWNFDDFSWGQTRQVAGADSGHGDEVEEDFDISKIPMKKWEDYEKAWRRNILRNREIMKHRQSSAALSTDTAGSNDQPFTSPITQGQPTGVTFSQYPSPMNPGMGGPQYAPPPQNPGQYVQQYPQRPLLTPQQEYATRTTHMPSNTNFDGSNQAGTYNPPRGQQYQQNPPQTSHDGYNVPRSYVPQYEQYRSPYMRSLSRMQKIPDNVPSGGYDVSFEGDGGSNASFKG
ncbi:hypothetical protein HK098_006843 [Nowakowskiella sp. JEL0407]|nr:hypothetical protein HK098_006843 [Nowakowskiella sp. JEL0407]